MNKLMLYQRSTSPMMRRLFSTAASQQYESFDDNIFYTPVRKPTFSNGRTTIFHNTANPVPWEVKETTVKNFLGVFGMVIIDYLFHPGASVYTIGTLTFGLNWIYRLYGYMGHAITRIDLLEDGKTLSVTFKTGGTATLKVKDIVKQDPNAPIVVFGDFNNHMDFVVEQLGPMQFAPALK